MRSMLFVPGDSPRKFEKASGGVFHSPYRLARDLCLMAAAAAEVAPIDAVYTDIDNLAGLEQEMRAARRDGFSAKALIHPKHVDVVNAAFEPTEAERFAPRRRSSARPRAAATRRWPRASPELWRL
jgi:citrate lyase beta subunit